MMYERSFTLSGIREQHNEKLLNSSGFLNAWPKHPGVEVETTNIINSGF